MLQATVSVSIDFCQGRLLEVGKYVEGLGVCKFYMNNIVSSHLYFLVEVGGNFIYLLLWCHDVFHLHSDIHEMVNRKEMIAVCYHDSSLYNLGKLRLLFNYTRILIVPCTMLVSCSRPSAKSAS